MKHEFVTAYGPKNVVNSETVGEAMTKQSFKKDTDINFILAKFRKTGLIEHLALRQGDYTDLTDTPTDFHTAMLIVRDAEEMFSEIPADVRKRFNNDPGEFLEFATNSDNLPQMIQMGLAPNTDPPTPTPSPPAEPAAPEAQSSEP